MDETTLHRYTAAHATVTWDKAVCRHAATCVQGLPEVFNPRAKPWIAADAASFDALAATIARCPSGALKLYRPDGTLAVASGEPAPGAIALAALAKVRPNGPNVVSGNLVLAGERAMKPKPPATLVLCRCGMSDDKPFCDGTHTKKGFADPGLLPAGTQLGTRGSGVVTITPTPNGPLQCVGPLTVQGADGHTSSSDETRLCRCGQSETKPFCDGSHERVGFKD